VPTFRIAGWVFAVLLLWVAGSAHAAGVLVPDAAWLLDQGQPASREAYLARHPGLTLGYGIGATVLYLIPFAVFVASPFAAAGATLAYIDTEKEALGAVTPEKRPNLAANS